MRLTRRHGDLNDRFIERLVDFARGGISDDWNDKAVEEVGDRDL